MLWCREGGVAPVPATVLTAVALLGLAAAGGAGAYVDRPPPGHTGGFGEPTCAVCHRGAPVDDGEGALRLVVPATFVAGEDHWIEVHLVRDGMRRAGFQLGVRFAEGELVGRQAGSLVPVQPAVEVITAHELAYAAHTAAGSTVADGEARWQVRWRAPSSPAAPVVFHVAANAGNDDDSELGDFVHLASALSRPCTADGGHRGSKGVAAERCRPAP